MGINDDARRRIERDQAIAERRQQEQAAADSKRLQRASEEAKTRELLNRYVRWLIDGNVPPTGHSSKVSFRDSWRGSKGRHWFVAAQYESSDQYYNVYTLSVNDNGNVTATDARSTELISYEHLKEAIAKMVAHSLSNGGPAWPYDD